MRRASRALVSAVITALAACAQGTLADDAGGADRVSPPGDATGDVPPVPGDGGCAAGQARCGDRCVDPTTDTAHCGGCNRACAAGETCDQGRCGTACTSPRARCGAAATCVDLRTDPANCGVCGMMCPTGQACTDGRCGCATGATMCGAACVDTQTDTANCGACGAACPADQMCVTGRCQINCPAPRTICALGAMMTCADLTTDRANCGACGTACPAPANTTASCAASACRTSCNAGYGDCNAMPADGCEANLNTDARHCGACGNACPARTNASPVCSSAACGINCNAGFGDCNGSAADGCEVSLASNVTSCGACGTACPARPNAAPRCAGGMCGVTCNAGFGDCNGVATDGCEVDLASSDAHCGGCGRACGVGTRCTGGTCTSISTVIEDYEVASWPRAPWVAVAGATGTTSTACAHDGARGMSDHEWFYRTDVVVGAAGTRVSLWVRPGASGRVYMGFGARATGAWTCVAAPNTNQFLLQNNTSWGYTDLATAAQTYGASTWYRLEASFGAGGSVTCRLYSGAAGTTLLNTLSATPAGFTPGGIALRSFGGFCSDTFSR